MFNHWRVYQNLLDNKVLRNVSFPRECDYKKLYISATKIEKITSRQSYNMRVFTRVSFSGGILFVKLRDLAWENVVIVVIFLHRGLTEAYILQHFAA